jgi:hypothetical protein
MLLVLAACNSTGPDDGEIVPPPPPPPPPAPTIIDATWSTSALDQRANVGKDVQYRCPANGALTAPVWGTIIYTDDSAICVAAVHAGQIGAAAGGVVTVTIQPGFGNYVATTRGGVTSRSYGNWTGSFSFGPIGPVAVQWSTTASGHRGRHNEVFPKSCPATGTAGAVWGTDFYTDDSSICTAAVHQGAITRAAGGVVFVKILAGRSSYAASTRNGIISNAWPAYVGTFSFE